MKKLLPCLALCLAACGNQPLIRNANLEILPEVSISTNQAISAAGGGLAAATVGTKVLSSVAGISVGTTPAFIIGAAVALIYDPLAPNWEIREQRLADDTYRFDMRMKRYHTGGQGEAMQALRRRATALQVQGGYKEFVVVEYAEGVESKTFGAHRYAEAKLRLIRG